MARLAFMAVTSETAIMTLLLLHCEDKILIFRNKYSQKRNIWVSVPISTFMRLWVIYIFPRLVCLFCWRKYVDQSWDFINRSQTHECGNWGWGRSIPSKGIHKWDFRCSVLICLPLRGMDNSRVHTATQRIDTTEFWFLVQEIHVYNVRQLNLPVFPSIACVVPSSGDVLVL